MQLLEVGLNKEFVWHSCKTRHSGIIPEDSGTKQSNLIPVKLVSQLEK